MSTTTSIEEAIRSRLLIEFYYDGGFRIAEPYEHYVNDLGHEVLFTWQLAGPLKPGEEESWRRFIVHEIKEFRLLRTNFLARPHKRQKDSGKPENSQPDRAASAG